MRADGSTAFEVARVLTWTSRQRQFADLDLFNQMLAVNETVAHLEVLVRERVAASGPAARRCGTRRDRIAGRAWASGLTHGGAKAVEHGNQLNRIQLDTHGGDPVRHEARQGRHHRPRAVPAIRNRRYAAA